jgi:tRNA pseudouridine38-40 synthase
MRTLKLLLEYDGTAYQGWQIQATGPTIQGVLEEKLAVLLRSPVRVTAAGRTDAGVHALGQVVSFRTESTMPVARLLRGLNALLPRDIAVRGGEEVPEGFDARRSARGKLYRYRLWNTPERSAFQGPYAWHVPRPLDLDAMREAAQALLGEHDFSAFRAADCPAKNPVRLLRRLEILETGGPLLDLEIEATAFLKHMVRNIVGTLVEVGQGKRPAESLAGLLASRDRTHAGATAPPHGLFLVEIRYP